MFSPILRKVALVAGSEPFAQADQQKQRTDTPGDAEHGEKRTQLMRPEGAENLRENVDHHLHGITGGASLAVSVLGLQVRCCWTPVFASAASDSVLAVYGRAAAALSSSIA